MGSFFSINCGGKFFPRTRRAEYFTSPRLGLLNIYGINEVVISDGASVSWLLSVDDCNERLLEGVGVGGRDEIAVTDTTMAECEYLPMARRQTITSKSRTCVKGNPTTLCFSARENL